MTLQGYQFDKAKVTPEADAQLYSYLAQSSDNKVISGLTVTATGLNVYIAEGKALVQGRLVDNGQQMQLAVQANKTGYVCITIDLTQTNTSTGTPGTSNYVPVNNQLRLELVETLNRQDLNTGGGLIYTFPIYSYTSTGTSVSLTKIDNSFRPASTITSITVALFYDITVVFRRQGNLVIATIDRQLRTTLTTGQDLMTTEKVPSGYRPSRLHYFGIKRNANSNVLNDLVMGFKPNGDVTVTIGEARDAVFQGSTSYFTEDPLP